MSRLSGACCGRWRGPSSTGTGCKITPNTFTITHRAGPDIGSPQLAASLGIQLADRVFAPLLRKNRALPAREKEVFRTSKTLRRADTDTLIRIPVVQGERDRGDRNRQIGLLEIRPADISHDLPAGSDVEVTLDVDRSGLVTVVADVPVVDSQFELEANLRDITAPSQETLRAMLSEAEERLASLRTAAQSTGGGDALARLDDEGTVDVAREQVSAAAGDLGAAATAEERIRDLHVELDTVEDAVEAPALRRELTDALDAATELARRSGTGSDHQHLEVLRRRSQEAIESGNAKAMRDQLGEVGRFILGLQRRGPDWPVRLLHLLERQLSAVSSAAPLIARGKRAIAAEDWRELDAINEQLFRLIPSDQRDRVIGVEWRR